MVEVEVIGTTLLWLRSILQTTHQITVQCCWRLRQWGKWTTSRRTTFLNTSNSCCQSTTSPWSTLSPLLEITKSRIRPFQGVWSRHLLTSMLTSPTGYSGCYFYSTPKWFSKCTGWSTSCLFRSPWRCCTNTSTCMQNLDVKMHKDPALDRAFHLWETSTRSLRTSASHYQHSWHLHDVLIAIISTFSSPMRG